MNWKKSDSKNDFHIGYPKSKYHTPDLKTYTPPKENEQKQIKKLDLSAYKFAGDSEGDLEDKIKSTKP